MESIVTLALSLWRREGPRWCVKTLRTQRGSLVMLPRVPETLNPAGP
jgi:hypothetical protein